jgi:hypothetical protein
MMYVNIMYVVIDVLLFVVCVDSYCIVLYIIAVKKRRRAAVADDDDGTTEDLGASKVRVHVTVRVVM